MNTFFIKFIINVTWHAIKATSKNSVQEFEVAFFSETKRQKGSLAALNKYFGNEVSGKKIISKIESCFRSALKPQVHFLFIKKPEEILKN